MSTAVLILLAIADLSFLVLVHEFGHYIVARLMGIWVEEFGIGLPPRVRGKKIGQTIYSINALPLGGFVRLHGESSDMKVSKPDRAFMNKSKPARAAVALAGIFMNFVLAALCFSAIFWFTGIGRGVEVVDIVDGSPSHASGLYAGDIVLSANDFQFTDSQDFPYYLEEHAGQRVVLTIEREVDGEKAVIDLPVDVRSEPKKNEGYIGAVFSSISVYEPPVWQRPFVYTKYGLKDSYRWTKRITVGMGKLVKQLASGSSAGVAGPLGVTLTFAEAIKYGFVTTLNLTAIISINLAILNLVPFPPLDGSRVLLLIVEIFVGKKMVQKYEAKIYTIGMVILLLFIVLVTATEIPKLIHASSIGEFVESILQ